MRALLGLLVGITVLAVSPVQPFNGAAAAFNGAGAPRDDVLIISTLPATPGLPVVVDGVTGVTGADGTAAVPTTGVTEMLRVGNLSAHITAQPMDTVRDGVPVRISPARILKLGGAVLITLDVAWEMRFTFVGTGAGDIDQDKIGMVTIKSSTGEVEAIDPHQPVWLQGSRVVPQPGGMIDKKMYWTVQDVPYEGSNVVNASQQQVFPADTQAFEVELLFYTARISAHDAFFGWPTGSSVALTYPDHHVVVHPFDENGELVLTSLPRGSYSLTILGAGPRMNRPLAISRDQTLDLEFYSWLDLGLVMIALGGFVAATVIIGIGRRRALRRVELREGKFGQFAVHRAGQPRHAKHRHRKSTRFDRPRSGPPVVHRIGRLPADKEKPRRPGSDPTPASTLVGEHDA